MKAIVGTLATAAGAQTAATLAEQSERVILGASQSVILAAITGALIGVLLLPAKTDEQETPAPWPSMRSVERLMKVAALGGFVLGFALVSAWSVALLGRGLHLDLATQVPAAGLLGVFIRPLLPKYQTGLEGVAERLFGRIR